MSDAVKRVLVKEKLAAEGIAYLEEQGFAVDTGLDWTPDEFMARVGDYDALIIRSATRVTADVIEAAANLKVIGRAGVGVDNIDVEAATKRGIIVVNAPASNVLSAAEHTIAMIMACARNIPQAHGALKEGRWERSKYGGVELADKTLGIVGLGRIGFLVAERARGLKMRVVAYDPFVPAERFHELALERAETVEAIYAQADFITVHLPKNAETIGFVSDDAFAQMRDGVRIINVARGGIVDEAALARALDSGKVAAAAIDVWPVEPTTDDILLKYDQVVSTPHLGASTREAQLRAGTQVAEQVALALKGQFAPNAVNVPLVLGEEADELMPYLKVCELLGKLMVQIADGPVDTFEITYEGVISRYDTRILTLSTLSGLLSNVVEGEVNFVNVTSMAEERGIVVKESRQPAAVDFLNLITVATRDRKGELSVSGTTLGPKHKARLVKVYRQDVDIEPARYMAFLRYDDVPGMIGKIGTKMGALGINIAQMSVGRTVVDHKAVMGLTLDTPISEDDLQSLIRDAGLHAAKRVNLSLRAERGRAAAPPAPVRSREALARRRVRAGEASACARLA
ncbi:MAG: phosphoglycerate dehydrogenase, partial [Thermoleophilia bacterium]